MQREKEDLKEKFKQIIDANANRAREGIRVIEEVARFILEDKDLTIRLKEIRHQITKYIKELNPDKPFIFSRESSSDLGAKINLDSEKKRFGLSCLIEANFKRVEEAIRVLEEFLKVYQEEESNKFKDLRFEVYQVEKELNLIINEHYR
ncbi:thiamine-phosphate pyrophosphorylase [bacterium]|nr:thiamine-phosphate pyrophosphorylase [bacterium]MBU0899820.1 thiamine-phosphate pyrophosphorylase [bacterium]MBU1152368.1 thiamine-phosphate pyrophosphorylase [bacterium]MBU1782327.1 thiamine-phosphate pyrophosphorylase [bacterium]MBU2599839.1 thiamine-phosphate pyrophosphorylase [bacterium]